MSEDCSPSPFVSSILVIIDIQEKLQQGYFFSRPHQVIEKPPSETQSESGDSLRNAFFETEAVEDLLVAMHTAFPKIPLSKRAKDCLAKRTRNSQTATKTLDKTIKRRKTLSANAFYGTIEDGLFNRSFDHQWRAFYKTLQFRVSHSLLCQLEGTAPLFSSFPRQQEAFEFADQVVALRRQWASSARPYTDNPRVFSFESAPDGRRRFLVASFQEFWKNYETCRADQRHVYEIIREGVPCRLYFDLEFKRAINPAINGDALVARLVSLLQLQLVVRKQLLFSWESQFNTDFEARIQDLRKVSRHLSAGFVHACKI